MSGESRDRAPADVVTAFYAAIRDSQVDQLPRLVDPQVVCQPVVRPGRSMYYGYDGIARLARDMHAAHGNYQIEIDEIAERPGPVVTVRATVLPEPGHGLGPLPVTTCYAFRDGLILSVDSQEGFGAPEPVIPEPAARSLPGR